MEEATKEPWDLKPNDTRVADSLNTFIIFCEDEHHEKLYFQSFEERVPNLKINAISNMRAKKLNLIATIQIGVQKGLIGFENGSYSVLDGVTEHLWCVYDRDMEYADWAMIPAHNHVDFDTAIITAESAGLKVAWSNDVFEMWLLLHFEPIPQGNILHRTYIYDRLTHIFKNEVPHDAEMAELTANNTFNYKANMKRRDRFINQVIPLLHPRTKSAITNASHMELQFDANVPFHLRNPCTMVHYLVKEIMSGA
jgi:RloB-like protein